MQHIFQQIYFQIVSAGLGRFALNLPFHIFLVNFININFAQNESLKIDIDLELIRRIKLETTAAAFCIIFKVQIQLRF
jgi:hypothetical protein